MARSRKATPAPVEEVAPPAPEPTPAPAARKGSWLVQFVLPLLLGAGLLGGIVWVGQRAARDLAQRDGHHLAFGDIICDPPPGLSRTEFLEEVQYLAGLPDDLDVLAPDLFERIAQAFEQHPWVARISRVERVGPPGLRVVVEYRTPVLEVAGPDRMVDAGGVLLPRAERPTGLPVLTTGVAAPTGRPGEVWGDPRVEAAAAVAGMLRPHLERLKLAGCTLEVNNGEVVVACPGIRILWGHPPGKEADGEAKAKDKLQRLLDSPALAGQEHDVRPADGVRRMALMR